MLHTDSHVEYISLALLIGAFIFVVAFIKSVFLSYVIIFLWGALFGRIWYKSHAKLRRLFMLGGFLIGYAFASAMLGGSILMIFVLYLLGMWGSFYLHENNYVKSIEF